MDGRESKLTRKVFGDPELKKILEKQISETGSCLGAKFFIDGKNYIITEGDLYSIDKKVQEIIDRLKKEYGQYNF